MTSFASEEDYLQWCKAHEQDDADAALHRYIHDLVVAPKRDDADLLKDVTLLSDSDE